MDLERYIDDPARYKRSYCAVEDKSWSAQGVDAERMFEAMSEIDRYAAAQLAMKAAFGLLATSMIAAIVRVSPLVVDKGDKVD